jgi:hypothetical protein
MLCVRPSSPAKGGRGPGGAAKPYHDTRNKTGMPTRAYMIPTAPSVFSGHHGVHAHARVQKHEATFRSCHHSGYHIHAPSSRARKKKKKKKKKKTRQAGRQASKQANMQPCPGVLALCVWRAMTLVSARPPGRQGSAAADGNSNQARRRKKRTSSSRMFGNVGQA